MRVNEEFRGAGPETLANYDLVVVNYYNRGDKDRWGDRANAALEAFVRSGKGLVLYHLALGAFDGWTEYEKMSGGNWRPNNGHHSARHDFTVDIKDTEHPITRGLKSFRVTTDELYANLRWQPEGSYHVLATAYDDHALYQGKARQPIPGAGIHQPMLWTTQYGSGRVFVTTLGHGPDEVRESGFGTTFARGAEWAATGKVTLPIPPALAATAAPKFRVDPAWPKIPNNWQFGQVASVSVDADRITCGCCSARARWAPEEKRRAAPPVLEFDADGQLHPGLGRPGPGLRMAHRPSTAIYVDPKGFVWIGGNGTNDHQILKFTKAGKFVMQIGRAGQSKGNADTQNLNQPADTFVHAKTNELFVADGYGNRRMIVFDADTGKFKRMWGAFGNVPTDDPPNPALPDAEPTGALAVRAAGARRARVEGRPRVRLRSRRQARAGVHARWQVRHAGVHRPRMQGAGMRQRHDGGQHGVLDRSGAAVPLRRQSKPGQGDGVRTARALELLDSFGEWGSAPGEFGTLHHMAADSKGNLYVTEVTPLRPENRRVQKFILLALTSYRYAARRILPAAPVRRRGKTRSPDFSRRASRARTRERFLLSRQGSRSRTTHRGVGRRVSCAEKHGATPELIPPSRSFRHNDFRNSTRSNF